MFPKDEMLGFCSSCGVKIIALGHNPRFLKNYKEHFVSLSNGTLMKVGVCDVCKVQLVAGDSEKTADKILENHKEYWANHKIKVQQRYYKKAYVERPPFFEKLEIDNPNTSPKDFFRKLEKDQREREELKAMRSMTRPQ